MSSDAQAAALYHARKRKRMQAAVVPSLSAEEVDEGFTGTMATISSNGYHPSEITYSINGGADAANFSISGTDLDVDVAFVFATQQVAEVVIQGQAGTDKWSRKFEITINETP